MMAFSDDASGLSAMAQRNLRLLETGDYHDFVIKCGSRTFNIHRNIVCPQSVMLASLCDPNWKEGAEGIADLKEEDPEIIEKALRFLYSGTYNGHCSCRTDTAFPGFDENSDGLQKTHQEAGKALLTDVRVYVLADYLGVEGLRVQALENCTHQLVHHFHADKLVEPIFVALANTKSDDDGLRSQVLRACVMKSAMVQACPKLEQIIKDQEPLAWTLLLEAQQQHDDLHRQFDACVTEASAASLDLKNRTKELERAHDNLRATVKLVNVTKGCRNETCDKDFGAALETYANGYIKSLRCKRCKCRHSIT